MAEAAAAAAAAEAEAAGDAAAAAADADEAAPLTIYLFDAVTGRSVHVRRIARAGAVGPVAVALHGNWLVYSFWSSTRQRTELGVATLWEGAVGVGELTPWSSAPVARRARNESAGAPRAASSLGAAPPTLVHKTFVLPVGVRALAFVATREGVTPPALLVTTAADALLSLDLRMIDPRRPAADGEGAAAAAKLAAVEGLVPYSPFLPVRASLYLNHGVPLHRAHTVLTAPTDWESTGLVVSIGAEPRARERGAPRRAGG